LGAIASVIRRAGDPGRFERRHDVETDPHLRFAPEERTLVAL
jgi:hypothetical protein